MFARFIVVCALCFTATFELTAQERYKPDSLLQVLETATGSRKVEILRHLSRAYIGADREKTLLYARQSVDEAEKLGNDTFIVRSLNNLAAAYQNFGDRRASLPLLEKAIAITRKNGNKVQLGESLEFLATAYAGMRQTDKAVEAAKEALRLAEELRDTVALLNGLEIIAEAHKSLFQFEEAIKVYERERAILRLKPDRLFETGRACVNMGEVLAKMGREEEALALFKEGKSAFETLGYPVGALIANIDMANLLLDQQQYAAAEKSFREVIDMNKNIGEPEVEAISSTGMGVVAMVNRRYPEALEWYQKAETAAKSESLYAPLKELYGYMNDLYCLKGDYETAKKYKALANDYADSLSRQDIRERVSEFQVQYETAEKEKSIAQQQLQITAQQSEIFQKNTLNYGLSASMLVLLGLGYLFYNRFKLRKQAELDAAVIREQKLGLNAVIEAQESERKRIARDLHDGIAQELVALKLGFELLRRKVQKTAPDESDQLEELTAQLNASCTEVRNIAHVMAPPVLEQHGLAPSVELLLRHTVQPAGLQVEFEQKGITEQIDGKTEIGLYRILQELLNNIIKHANASKVVIRLLQQGNEVVMQVEDDGKGFDFESVRSKGTMGVLNILTRVSTLGGTFFSEKVLPHGTVSVVKVPVF